MPLAEYAGQHFQRGVPLYETMLERCVAWAEGRYAGWVPPRARGGLLIRPAGAGGRPRARGRPAGGVGPPPGAPGAGARGAGHWGF
jgi:hypothetical protein